MNALTIFVLCDCPTRFANKDYLTLEDLQLFLEGEQGVSDLSLCLCAFYLQFDARPVGLRARSLGLFVFAAACAACNATLTSAKRALAEGMSTAYHFSVL